MPTQWNRENDVLYCHLPKCGGTTVVGHLTGLLRAYPIQWGNIAGSFAAYLATPSNGKFVYGHFRHQQMEALESSGRQYRLFTFLRDPIERLISAYRYTATPGNPGWKAFKQKYPTFEAYAEWYPANDICDWLVGGADSVEEYLEKLDARFGFIGVQEYFDAGMTALMGRLGARYQPGHRMNVSTGPEVNTWPDLRAYLYEKHRLDIEAHQQIAKRWETVSAQ